MSFLFFLRLSGGRSDHI